MAPQDWAISKELIITLVFFFNRLNKTYAITLLITSYFFKCCDIFFYFHPTAATLKSFFSLKSVLCFSQEPLLET
jgi:hypothetical protein